MKWLLFLNRYIRTLLLEGSPTNTIASNIQHNPIFIINIQYNPIFMGTAYNYGSFPLQTNKPKSQILYWQFTEVKRNNFFFLFYGVHTSLPCPIFTSCNISISTVRLRRANTKSQRFNSAMTVSSGWL